MPGLEETIAPSIHIRLNDNKLSAERISPSEPSVTVMGKVVLLKLQKLSERSESFFDIRHIAPGIILLLLRPAQRLLQFPFRAGLLSFHGI